MLNFLTVTERVFSILLQGFISNLNTFIEMSKKHEIINDVSIHFIIEILLLNNQYPGIWD